MKIIAIVCIGIIVLGGYSITALPHHYHTQQLTRYFPSLTINENKDCVSLEIKGTNDVLTAYHHYTIPTRIETFSFPIGTQIKSVSCHPRNIQRDSLEKPLSINPEPVTLAYDSPKIKECHSKPGTIERWYDYDIGSGINGNEKKIILKVQLYPIQYNQLDNSYQWAKSIEIKIQYILPEVSPTVVDEYDFIILSPSEFSDEIEPLVTHKNNKGLHTKSVTLDEIYDETYFPRQGRDNPEHIKYFIKNAIEQWGIDYVLLIGGYDLFPTRKTHVYVEYFDVDEPFLSDLYYADIYDEDNEFQSWDSNNNGIFAEYDWGSSHLTDEMDLYPDIKIGRLACIDEAEVNTCVGKIIQYESDEAYSKEWFTNIVSIGGDTFTDDTWGIDEGEYVNEQGISYLNGFIPNKIWISNGRLNAPSPSGINEINDAINQGCGFVHFSGHGSPNLWATHPHENEGIWLPKPWGYYNSKVIDLNNNEKLPIVILDACSTCKFNLLDNCFGWSFLSNPNGGGIGAYGVTTFGYAFGGGKKITEGFIGEIILNIFEGYSFYTNQRSSLTLGNLWNYAISDYISTSMEVRDIATIESFQFFGDPTLQLSSESEPPETPEKPIGSTSIKPGKIYNYSTSTNDPEGDDIYYLFDWGDDSTSEWIGPYESGEHIEIGHKWENKGRYQIKVKAKDENGKLSDWSEALEIKLSKNKIDLLSLLNSFIYKFYEFHHTTQSYSKYCGLMYSPRN